MVGVRRRSRVWVGLEEGPGFGLESSSILKDRDEECTVLQPQLGWN